VDAAEEGRIGAMPDVKGELERLRSENARLRKLLKLTDAEAVAAHGTQAAWFDKVTRTGRRDFITAGEG
jgi:hypothetical protein